VAIYDVEIEPKGGNTVPKEDFDIKLRKPAKLREDNLLAEDEYQKK